MSIMDYFPEYKLATVVAYSQTKTYNLSGEVVYSNVEIFDGIGWFWQGGEAEVFENQQERNDVSWQLILDSADLTTIPGTDDIATIDGVTGYRLGQPQKYFDGGEFYLYQVNRREGV